MRPQRASAETIASLQEAIEKIEGGYRRAMKTLPFGVPELDRRVPNGGLSFGAIHEIGGGGNDAVWGAAPALFTAGIAARCGGPILWCLSRPDLFAPALGQVGLDLDRLIFCESNDDLGVQESFEEALRFGGLGAVVAEMTRLPMDISRRFQLAAEKTGTMGLIIRRWRRQSEVTDFGHPTAASTRWRISSLPSTPLPVPGLGRARWIIELLRARAGESFDLEVEACDATGHLAIPEPVRYGVTDYEQYG